MLVNPVIYGSSMSQMDCLQVLRRLSEIERAVGVFDSISIRRMLIETQDYILQAQKDAAQSARMKELRTILGKQSNERGA